MSLFVVGEVVLVEVAGRRIGSAAAADWVAAILALATSGIAAGTGVLIWRVLCPLELTEVSDTADATLRALIEIGDADTLARRALFLLWDRKSWVIRRVERIQFTDRTMVRRRVSVDFRMPEPVEIDIDETGALSGEDLELLAAAAAPTGSPPARAAFVPISLLRGWPPVLNLDLRNLSGEPIPLLSKAATNTLDSRILYALATQAFGTYAEELRDPLETLVYEDGFSAEAAYEVFKKGSAKIQDLKPDVDQQMASRVDELARALVRSTLLWTPATADPGTRTIVKLAYDEPLLRHLGSVRRSLLATVGLRSIVAGFEVGQVGDSGSYHLEIEVPPPLTLLSADLIVAERRVVPRRFANLRQRVARFRVGWRVLIEGLEIRIALAFDRPWPRLIDRANHSQVFTRRAHLYTSGQPSRPALAMLRMIPERRGVPLTGAITAALAAALLQGLTDLDSQIYLRRDSSGVLGSTLAFLLLAPTMVSYVLSRGTEHAFAARALAGVRGLTISSILLCVVAGATLVASVVRRDPDIFVHSVPILRSIAITIAFILVAGLVLPPGRRWRRGD